MSNEYVKQKEKKNNRLFLADFFTEVVLHLETAYLLFMVKFLLETVICRAVVSVGFFWTGSLRYNLYLESPTIYISDSVASNPKLKNLY